MNANEHKATSQPFIVSRVYDAPIALMWKVWTEPEHLSHWWGPKGFKVLVSKMDFRVGGRYHYCLEAPDGSKMWGKFQFEKIDAPHSMVYISSFSDEAGGTTRHPMHMSWPLEMKTEIRIEAEAGKTKVTVIFAAHNANALEQKTFDDNRPSMNNGWGGTLDQLGEYLKQAQ